MQSLRPRLNSQRLPLVGRIHSLRLTGLDVAFRLAVQRNGAATDYLCHSNRPEIMTAALDLEPGQLVGIIGVAPSSSPHATGFHVERLEVLGRAQREAVA